MEFIKIDPDNAEREVVKGTFLSPEDWARFDHYSWPNEDQWAEYDYPSRWGENGPLNPIHGSPGNWGKEVGWDKEFVKHNDEWIDLSDMMASTVPGWDKIRSDSFFSGILIKYARECDHSDVQHYNQCPTGRMDTDAVYIANYYTADLKDWSWAVSGTIHQYHQKVQNDDKLSDPAKLTAEAHLWDLSMMLANTFKRWHDSEFDIEGFMKSATGRQGI